VKINFTKKEYRLLLEMLYLADWMMESHSVDTVHKEHEKLRKKILSHYREMSTEDIIEYSEANDDYYELREFDDYIHEEFIDPYNTEIFWEELADRLSTRDAIAELGSDRFKSMDGMERVIKLGELADRYEDEFESHGLERVIIDHTS
jgi:hypothetical protein